MIQNLFVAIISYMILSYLFCALRGFIEWRDFNQTEWIPAELKNDFRIIMFHMCLFAPITFFYDLWDMWDGTFHWTMPEVEKALWVEKFISLEEGEGK